MFKRVITFFTLIITFITLLSLGFWQLDRLQWKKNMVASMTVYEQADPVTTALNLDNPNDFQRGFIRGEYLNTQPIMVSPRTHEGQSGVHLYQAFRTVEGQDILINRGWIPKEDDPIISVPAGQTVVAGYLKSPSEKNNFVPANNSDQNLWHSIDLDELNTLMNIELESHILYQEYPIADHPKSFSGLPEMKNNHLQYAIFWFFMAGILPILCLIRFFKKS